jgi:hypothetical protein
MRGNAFDSHTLVVGEHPNYHIWDTILGLAWKMLIISII